MPGSSQHSSAKQRLLMQAEQDYCAQLVAVDQEAIARLPVRDNSRFSLMASGLAGKPQGENEAAAAAYIIALNSLNFMFWQPTTEGVERYAWNGDVGARGLRAAFDSAWGAEPGPVRMRERFGHGEEQPVVEAFGNISLARRRAQMLREVLAEDQLEQAAAELVAASARGLLSTDDAAHLARRFPIAYGRDAYLKRAQLVLIWFAGYLAEQGRQITLDVAASADYQMPRVMRAIGVLRYAPELAAMVDKHVLILSGSAEERAIRAATILCAKAMATHLGVSEPALDSSLWRKREACGAAPYHLTVTTDY